MLTRKQKEVSELLRRELSNILLYELNDPRMGFTTVTRVEAAKDLQSAKVYITVHGTEEDLNKTLKGVEHARGYIQHLIGERLPIRFTPVLEFMEDEDLARAKRISNLIDEVRKQDKAVGK